jgi:hypothetical protein
LELYYSLSVFSGLSKGIIKIIFTFDHMSHIQSFILLNLRLIVFWRCILDKDLLIWFYVFTFTFIFIFHLLELSAAILYFIFSVILISRFISEMALLKNYLSIKILLLMHIFWILNLLFGIKCFLTVVFLLLVFYIKLIISYFLIFLNLLLLILFLIKLSFTYSNITFRFLFFFGYFFIFNLFLFLIIILILFIKFSQFWLKVRNWISIILITIFDFIDISIVNL